MFEKFLLVEFINRKIILHHPPSTGIIHYSVVPCPTSLGETYYCSKQEQVKTCDTAIAPMRTLHLLIIILDSVVEGSRPEAAFVFKYNTFFCEKSCLISF